MPVISMFYGIIIRMYLLDNKHHNLPHIHAKYAEFEASICIEDVEILAGQLPRKQLRLVQAWIELHRDELMADWGLTISNESPYFNQVDIFLGAVTWSNEQDIAPETLLAELVNPSS